MAKKRKLVEVIWEDAHSGESSQTWAFYDEDTKTLLAKASLCTSVGYLLNDTGERIVIAASITAMGDDEDITAISGTMSIPRGMIRKVRVLK